MTSDSSIQNPLRVALLGAGGRMGKTIIRCLTDGAVPGLQLSGAVDLWDHPDLNKEVAPGVLLKSNLADVAPTSDVVIDFTSHQGTSGNAERLANWGKAWVIGTTGLSTEQRAAVEAASKKIAIVMAPNMSLGVNLLFVLLEDAARALKEKGYDVEIIERHHRLNPLTHIWQPATTPSKDLVVVLHGLGDSAEGFLWLQDELGIDSLNFLLLNAPRPYYIGFSWYDLPPHQLPGILQSRQLLGEVFSETERKGYPPERTFLLGFSQGCLMTMEFGSRHSPRLAGYIGISGYCYDPAAILREMNPEVNNGGWLVTHGTEDDVLPVEATRAQIHGLNDGGFRIDYREYRKSHTIDPERELPEIREWMHAMLLQRL